MSRVNKQELAKQVASKAKITVKDAKSTIDALTEVITDALSKGEKVQLIGFGSFEVRDRAERKGHNPQTGEEITIPATQVPAFRPGRALKDAVK